MNYDIIIIGGGPAGISAALYTKRSNITTLIISMQEGNLHKAELVENYYGLAKPTTGEELFKIGHEQARSLGIPIVREQVVGLEYNGNYLVTTEQNRYTAKAVIIATGVSRKTPKIKNLVNLEGKGVSYCAICDAFFYRGKDVAVIGCGEYALHEAKELLASAKSVTIYTNGAKALFNPSPEINVDTRVIEAIEGTDHVEGLKLQDGTFKQIDGVFIALGIAGSTSFAKTLGAATSGNKLLVNENMATNIPGLFACGDATGGLLQIAKAVYEGAVAGLESVKYVRTTSR